MLAHSALRWSTAVLTAIGRPWYYIGYPDYFPGDFCLTMCGGGLCQRASVREDFPGLVSLLVANDSD